MMRDKLLMILELSIISNAPFTAGFLEIILQFKKCWNAPFLASFWHDQVEALHCQEQS